MKLIVLTVTLAALVAGASGIAEACGVWHLQDKGLKRKVTFYVENVLITRPKGKRGPRKMILRISGKSAEGMYSKLGRRKHMYFEGHTLRRRGKLIGTITGDTLGLRKGRFTIGVTHRPEWGPHHHWEVKVTRGERLVASGKAMALCMGSGAPPGEQDAAGLAVERKEIQRRVILYLAWRQLMRR
jgi:hypothetical protein